MSQPSLSYQFAPGLYGQDYLLWLDGYLLHPSLELFEAQPAPALLHWDAERQAPALRLQATVDGEVLLHTVQVLHPEQLRAYREALTEVVSPVSRLHGEETVRLEEHGDQLSIVGGRVVCPPGHQMYYLHLDRVEVEGDLPETEILHLGTQVTTDPGTDPTVRAGTLCISSRGACEYQCPVLWQPPVRVPHLRLLGVTMNACVLGRFEQVVFSGQTDLHDPGVLWTQQALPWRLWSHRSPTGAYHHWTKTGGVITPLFGTLPPLQVLLLLPGMLPSWNTEHPPTTVILPLAEWETAPDCLVGYVPGDLYGHGETSCRLYTRSTAKAGRR